jgi:hypothetical protein
MGEVVRRCGAGILMKIIVRESMIQGVMGVRVGTSSQRRVCESSLCPSACFCEDTLQLKRVTSCCCPVLDATEGPDTGGKRGFHSTHLSRTKFDPRLKGPSVPVHLKMWAREHQSRFKRDLQSRFHLTAGTNAPWSFSPGSWNKPGLKVTL